MNRVAGSAAIETPDASLAATADLADVVRDLEGLFGQKVTAAIAGVRQPVAVGRWAHGEDVPNPEAERRLRAAHQVATLLREVESDESVVSWFLGMNPHLDDQAPAGVVADDPARVLRVARAYVASG